MRAALAGLVALLLLAGCGPNIDEQRAENRRLDAIPAGTFSNVRVVGDQRDMVGLTLALPQGSDSQTALLTDCQRRCSTTRSSAVRRGLNGIFFELPGNGEGRLPTLVAVEPAADGVTLRADWGQGLEEFHLKRQPDQ